MIVIGVDLGMTGALAAIDPRGTSVIHDLPISDDDDGKRLNGRDLILLLRVVIPTGEAAMVVAEDVRVRQQGNGGKHFNSAHSQGSLMISRGVLQAVCDIARLKLHYIQPATWKASYGLIKKKKEASRQMALKLYPACAKDLQRVKDQNRAESLLLAHYGQAHLT